MRVLVIPEPVRVLVMSAVSELRRVLVTLHTHRVRANSGQAPRAGRRPFRCE